MISLPYLGHGVGLRTQHYATVLEEQPRVDWFECISENFMVAGGNPRRVLRRVRERYPVVLHGVSLSIGSVDPLDAKYLDELAALARETEPAWVSDHLCWSSVGGNFSHDLLPLPYTEEALAHVAARVRQVQDKLGRQILIENVSSYVTFTQSTLTEWQFLAELCQRADCGLLLDVNNVFVSAFNHEFDPMDFLRGIPRERVRQFHLAGHTNNGTHIVDTHDHPIIDGVWDLYAEAVRLFPGTPTMIERDADIPPYEELLAELDIARRIAAGLEQEVVA